MRIEIWDGERRMHMLNVADVDLSEFDAFHRFHYLETHIAKEHGKVLDVLKYGMDEPRIFYVLQSKMNL